MNTLLKKQYLAQGPKLLNEEIYVHAGVWFWTFHLKLHHHWWAQICQIVENNYFSEHHHLMCSLIVYCVICVCFVWQFDDWMKNSLCRGRNWKQWYCQKSCVGLRFYFWVASRQTCHYTADFWCEVLLKSFIMTHSPIRQNSGKWIRHVG